jgi:hypothetical protein
MNKEVVSLVVYISRTLSLSTLTRKDEEEYASLPVCVIDAVFSIGVR